MITDPDDSHIGNGCTFWIVMQADSDPGSRFIKALNAKADETPPPAVQKQRVLLYVEDNLAKVQLMERLIARQPDMRLLTAKNGTVGLAIARSAMPDVILMDINLPVISGIETMRILRDDAATARIPIVALRANAMPSDIEKGLEAGFFRYLTKPIKVDAFMETLLLALAVNPRTVTRLNPHGKRTPKNEERTAKRCVLQY
jgi:CheY-like chemotaxis protein